MTDTLYKMVDGEPIPLTPEEIAEYEAQQAAAAIVTTDQVNAERERRLLKGETFGGVYITGDDTNRSNLSGLAFGASLRISQGDVSTVTVFRDGNNVDHDLTPPQMLALWQQAAGHVSMLYEKSWALKAMEPIPQDYADDGYWTAA